MSVQFSRREMLKEAGASLVLMGAPGALAQTGNTASGSMTMQDQTRAQRMQWWHAARFGMFIHFGVYSTIERHEWVMEDEAIPIGQYTPHAAAFRPVPNSPRAWAKLAKTAGMKYMVMTTKHHEGFCNFDTKLTNYCAPKQGPGRDLVREYVEAARAEGMHVGFYYSLMDWHHPDGARCATGEAARRRFVDYTHRQLPLHACALLPGEYVALSGLRTRVKSAHFVKGGAEIKFTQDDFQTKLIGLPERAPDSPITTIAIECESEPTQDTDYVRKNKPWDGV